MKLQIDTSAKTIKVDETTKIVELIKVIKKLLPNDWQAYSLETGSVLTWYNPYVWKAWEPVRWETTCGTSVYNVECLTN